jgi:hypothetical protein
MNTYCYTYEISMIVQILAPNEEQASELLDNSGGYVSGRVVNLLDTKDIHIVEEKKG